VVCDILLSDEYDLLAARLRRNLDHLTAGLTRLGLVVMGGQTPIVSVLVGDEEDTLKSGNFLFEEGFYVQSVTFPAVPYHAGALPLHAPPHPRPDPIDALLDARARLQRVIRLPEAGTNRRAA